MTRPNPRAELLLDDLHDDNGREWSSRRPTMEEREAMRQLLAERELRAEQRLRGYEPRLPQGEFDRELTLSQIAARALSRGESEQEFKPKWTCKWVGACR